MKIILLFCEAKCPYKSVLHSIGLKIKLSTISAALPWLIELSFPLKGARLLFRIKAVNIAFKKAASVLFPQPFGWFMTLTPSLKLILRSDSFPKLFM